MHATQNVLSYVLCKDACIQGCGLPVVYTWVDWLQTHALEHLGAARALDLSSIAAQPAADASAGGLSNGRQHSTVSDGGSAHVAFELGKSAASSAHAGSNCMTHSAADGGTRTPDELFMQLMLYDTARDYSLFRQVKPLIATLVAAQE